MQYASYTSRAGVLINGARTSIPFLLRAYLSWLRPWLIAVAACLAPYLAVAGSQPVPGNAQGKKIVEVRVVDASQPVTLTRTFHLNAPTKMTALVRNWQVPEQGLAGTLPKVDVIQLQAGVWKVDVTVFDVTSVGVYSGELVFKPEGSDSPGDQKTYELVFVATFKPAVAITPVGALALRVSNCEWFCALTELFAPETRATNYAFQVKNLSPASIDMNVRFAALGVASALPPLQLIAGTGKEEQASPALEMKDVPPNGTAILYATVANSGTLSPGTYTGSLEFTATPSSVRGVKEYLVGERANDGTYVLRNAVQYDVSSTVSVKSSVLGALLAVLLGVVAGRVVATLSMAGFDQKLHYFPLFQELSKAIRDFPDGPFRSSLEIFLNEAWDAVLAGGNAQVSEDSFAKLGKQVTLASGFFSLMEEVKDLPDEQRKLAVETTKKALAQLANRSPDFEQVIKLRAELLQILEEHPSSDFDAMHFRAMEGQLKRWGPAPQSRLANGLALLAGTGTAGVGLYYRYLRPIMYMVLLLVLVIYGLWQNYSTGADAATFGVQGISEYAALFLWGISADIVNKTFQQISFKRS